MKKPSKVTGAIRKISGTNTNYAYFKFDQGRHFNLVEKYGFKKCCRSTWFPIVQRIWEGSVGGTDEKQERNWCIPERSINPGESG